MRVTWINHLLLLVYFSCNSQNDGMLLSDGVLLPSNISVTWHDTVSIHNYNQDLYAEIWSDKDGVTIVSYSDTTRLKNSIINSMKENYIHSYKEYENRGILPKISIRSFDDGYDSPLIVFDAKKQGENYQVFVNGEWKGIKYPKPLVYKKWSEFILTVNVGISSISPLRTTKGNGSDIIDDYEKYSYKVVKVDGDWLQVQCWSDCEGCPDDGSIIKGWVKWTNGDKLLIELYYIC